MKKITIALAAALAVLSACEKTPALPVVQFDKTNYILPADEPVTVKVVSDVALTDDVTFTLGGTAVKDVDYTVSPETFSFKESTVAEITITPLYNAAENDIVIELLGKGGSYNVGTASKTTVVTTPKKKIICNFAQTQFALVDVSEVTVSLIDPEKDGKAYKAESELKIPFEIEGSAVEGKDFEIVGGEHYFVAKVGDTEAKVSVKSLLSEITSQAPSLKICLQKENPRFPLGVNGSADVVYLNPELQFKKMLGKWSYSSYPLKDDPEADKSTFDMLILDAGDTWETNVPCKNTTSDVVEFKTVDGKNQLAVSGSGDIFDYLADAEVTKIEHHPYSWYYYEQHRPWGISLLITLSKVNYNFNKKPVDYKTGTIILNLSEDGETLDLVIPASSYDPINGDYFKAVRSAYEGLVWTMYVESGYWDCYYQFKKVAE